MRSKTMENKLRSKQLKTQSKLILIHEQYALKANILMSWKQLDHGDLYKQVMVTCASTKVLGVKVFSFVSEKYHSFIFSTEIWIWVLLYKIQLYKLQI